MKKFLLLSLTLFVCIAIYKFEGEKPVAVISIPSPNFHQECEILLNVNDKKSGIRTISVSIHQNGKNISLIQKDFTNSNMWESIHASNVKSDQIKFSVRPKEYNMEDGEIILQVLVSDSSWRRWNKGNSVLLKQKLFFDETSPKTNILSRTHNISQGGSAIIIYEVFEDNLKSGVFVEDNFFPGNSGLFKNRMIYTAFFAIDHIQDPETKIWLSVKDIAGNTTKKTFNYHIKSKKFKTDTIRITDRFLARNVADFDIEIIGNATDKTQDYLINKFLFLNKQLRDRNVKEILKTSTDSRNELYWEGRFLRLSGAAKRGGFADKRLYQYNDQIIDQATHFGIDLASTSQAPVNAANTGRVLLVQTLGIFGNSVMIDHGFGLSTLYSHLSEIYVEKGEYVSKGGNIGLTGETGLVGGDHLHFSMIVHNVFVNPIEWWDSSWIKNNITSKIEYVRQK